MFIFFNIFAISLAQNMSLNFVPPPPYGGISSIYLDSTQSFIFASGQISQKNFLYGIQKFSIDNTTGSYWRYESEENVYYPNNRAFYGSFLYNNRYYIFGGVGGSGVYKDLWYYDLVQDEWTQVVPLNSISRRFSYAYTSFTYTFLNNSQNTYFAVVGGKSNKDPLILQDSYLYDPANNYWITLPNIQPCFNSLGLMSAQLQFYSGSLYLFGGLYMYSDNITFFRDICKFTPFVSKSWTLISTGNTFVNSSRAGSCVFNDSLYSFFGITKEDNQPSEVKSIIRLPDLSNPEDGWEVLHITGCDSVTIERDSFGYTCIDDSVYINGGFTNQEIINSAIKLTFNDSLDSVVCEVLFENSLSPTRRNGASMVYVSGGFYLFGGQDEGTIYSDLWYFNLSSSLWSQPTSYNEYPSGRYLHSAASQGEFMIIRGGLGLNNKIFQDFYMLNTVTMTWNLIEPLDANIPPPQYGSCLALNFPKIYILGGVESTHVTLSLWEFDLSTMKYSKLYNYNKDQGIGVYGHACVIDRMNGSLILTSLFGAVDLVDTPSKYHFKFNLSSNVIIPVPIKLSDYNITGRSHFAYKQLDDELVLIAGGESLLQVFFYEVFIINTRNFTSYSLQNLVYPMYYSAYSFFNNTLYIFSGITNNGISFNSPSNDYIIQVTLSGVNINYKNWKGIYCGEGLFLAGEYCEICPEGYYNYEVNSDSCISCPEGTYSNNTGLTDIFQCIPCPAGTYSFSSSSYCIHCNKSQSCPIGTSASFILNESETETLSDFRSKKDQPGLYEPPNILDIQMILWLVSFCLIAAFSIAFILSSYMRIYISFYDIYKNMHFEVHSTTGSFIEKEQVMKPSKLGGYLSGVTLILLISMACNSMIIFIKTNEVKEIILVPIGSLIDDKTFDSQSLKIDLMFSSYRGDCSFEFLIVNTSENFKIKSKSFKEKDPFCYFHINGELKDIVKTNEFISFYFTDANAYTSDINIRLTTSSSIPGKKSIVTQHLVSDSGYVFRGYQDSDFYFSFLPAYYKDTSAFFETSHLGYFLSSTYNPIPGTQITAENLNMYSGLGVTIHLSRIEVGITSYKYERVETIDFCLKIMNDFPGTIVLIGFILWFIEYFINTCKGVSSGRSMLARRYIQKMRNREEFNTLVN